jgi:MHS family proline/betaine transporter-like MFS transporter
MDAGRLNGEKTVHVASQGIHNPGRRALRRAAVAASVGNLLEWYDFAVYGFLANIIAARFFAPADSVSALLSSFAVFGIGFLARPLGGIAIGRLADKRGRKPALTLTIILMALGTLMIAVLPTYAYIGFWAPALLVVARLIQGFSAGGEWGTATGFLVEWAPHGRRGFFGSLQQCTALAGLLIGSGVSALASSVIPTSQMEVWGWRVPFLLGALVGPIGFYVRRNVEETPAYTAQQNFPPSSQTQWGAATRLFALVAVPFAVVFTLMSYLPTFTQKYGGLSRSESLWANTVSLVILIVCIPIAGIWSDRIGRRPLMIASNLCFLFLSAPLLLATLRFPGFSTVVLVQIAFALMYAIYAGAGAAAYNELFTTSGRVLWLSVSYNISGIVFGAFAGYIATWLIKTWGSPIAVVYFVLFAAVVSGLGMIGMKETAHSPLR